jgi:hypothetical protein
MKLRTKGLCHLCGPTTRRLGVIEYGQRSPAARICTVCDARAKAIAAGTLALEAPSKPVPTPARAAAERNVNRPSRALPARRCEGGCGGVILRTTSRGPIPRRCDKCGGRRNNRRVHPVVTAAAVHA